MRPLLARYGPHAALIAARTATVILFCLAGVTVAGAYLAFLLALLVGVLGGCALALVADHAAVAYGRRLGRQETQEHNDRQQAFRDEWNAVRRDGARHDAPPAGTPAAGRRPSPRPVVAAAGVRPAAPVARHAAARPGGSRLHDDQAELDLRRDALVLLRELVNQTLQPHELIGQQGRGVIQLAHELGPQVPTLDAETVVAYVGDHVLIAAGLEADQPARWPDGLLAGVNRLRMPAGQPPLDNVVLERVDGLDRAAGEGLPGLLDTIVKVIANSGRRDGLFLTQIGVCLSAKGYRVGPYTLAAACRRLVRLGRLDKPTGEVRYRLTDRELGGDDKTEVVGAVQRAPLDVVFSVLNSGPLGGMTGDEIAAEVARRRSPVPTPAPSVGLALDALALDGRVIRPGSAGAVWRVAEAVTPAQILAGPGLRQHVLDLVAETDRRGGLGFDPLLEAVRARPGFADTSSTDLFNVLRPLVAGGQLVQQGDVAGSYRLPPF